MATYTYSYELEYTNLQVGDTVIIGGYKGRVESEYINFEKSPLGHKGTCDTFHDIHSLAQRVYSDTTSMWCHTQYFPKFTNMRDATKIAQELMRMYNGVEPRRGVPIFATEDGPIHKDATDALRYGTSVRYTNKPITCELEPMACELEPMACELEPMACELEPMACELEPMACAPESIEKKRLISFPKIR